MTGAFRKLAVLLILALGEATLIHAQTFAAGQTFPAPTHPNAVATADFNNDGIADIAVPSYSPNTLAIMMGDGNGGFGTPTVYTVGSGPRFAAISDLNKDGRPDIVVANQDSNDVSVMLATGPGTFAPQKRFYSGPLPYHLTLADLNKDGRDDAIVANSGGDTISVLLGDGNGGFGSPIASFVGTNPRGVTAADFNNDGFPDVAVSVANLNSVVLLSGDGTGAFSSSRTLAVGSTPYWLTNGDFNKDGFLDLAVPNFGSGTISVLLGNGAGDFSTSTITVGMSPRAITTADLNHDGKLDLIVANRDSSTLTILHGTGQGTFVSAGAFGTGFGPFYGLPLDVNADGQLDIIVANRDGHTISVLRGSGTGTVVAPRAFNSGANPRGVAAGDLNGDGSIDVVTANQAANTVSVLFGNGAGELGTRIDLAVKNAPYSPLIADFDNDGRADIAVANSSSNSVSVLRGLGNGTFATQVQSSAGSGPHAIAAADFNGDGYLDLVTANYNGGTASVLLGKGNGTFNTPLALTVGPNPTAVTTADFNHDGRPDVAVACAGSNDVRVFLANGPGTFANAFSYPAGTAPSGVVSEDFNHDGIPDLAVTNENSNNVSIFFGSSSGVFTPSANAIAVSARPLGIAVGRIDLDELPDLVVASATNNMLTVLSGNADGTFKPGVTIPAGVFSRGVALADFDGDSRLDIAVENMNGNDVWIVSNRTGTVADLEVNISNTTAAVRSGLPVSYEIAVSNLSNSEVSNLKLQLELPASIQSPTFSASSGTYDAVTGNWSGLTLSNGQQAILTLSGTLAVDATGSLKIKASVAAGAGFTDPVSTNNSAEQTDSIVRGDADLSVTISNGKTSVAAGDSVAYNVTVSNGGPIAVSNAQVTVEPPSTLQNVTWTCSGSAGSTCVGSGSSAIDQTANLPVGSSVTFVMSGTVDERAATGTLSVTASASVPSDVIDPVTDNNSATDSDQLEGDVPPEADAQSISVTEDASVDVVLAGTDADGDTITFSVASQPSHGTLSGTAPQLTYTPSANYSGPDSFQFKVDDGILSSTATVSITVTPVNDEPVAKNSSVSTSEDNAVPVTLSVSDPDGDTLAYTILTQPSRGTLSGTAPALTYTPEANFSGSDSFQFKVSDGKSESSATVTLSISAVNDSPTVQVPIADVQVNGDDLSASVSLAGRYSDVETPASALTIAVTSSDPSLVTPTLAGDSLNLALAAGRGGSAVITVRVSDPDGGTVDDAFTVTVTRPGVSIAISDTSRGEGSSAGLVFAVSLSGPSTTPVSVNFTTADGTATAGADYVPTSGTLTFAPGVTTRTIVVPIVADTLDELDETVSVHLSGAVGASLQNVAATGTILDDDTATISLLDVTVKEGNAGVTTAVFNITLSTPSSRTVTVNFATANISALAGSDYVARSGVVTFPAGSNAPQAVAIDVLGDEIDEPDQAFSLTLSNAVNASISRATGRATITDDDDPPVITVSDSTVVEGNSGTRAMVFTLTLSSKSEIRARVKYQTVNGTATAGSDYTAKSGEVSFDPGVTSKTVSIPVTGDLAVEPNEVFYLDLNTPTSATIGTPRAAGTIVNDDGQ